MTTINHDPLALELVDNAQIIARQKEIAEYPIYRGDVDDPIFAFPASAAYLGELKSVIDAWDTVGMATYAVSDLAGTVYYLEKNDAQIFWETLIQLKARRAARLLVYASELIAQNNATSDVTERDIHPTSWPSLDSNVEFPSGSTFVWAEIDPANKHADITISGASNSAISVASGSGWRTARLNQPVYRPAYWEFNVDGNAGDLYIGLMNDTPDLSANYKLGEDEHSVGVLITAETIKEALYNASVAGLTDYDCTVAGASRGNATTDIEHIVGLRYDPYIGLLEVCWGRDHTEYQTVKTGCHTAIEATGRIYPAISIYDSANVIEGHFGEGSTPNENYGEGYVTFNWLINIANGLFIADES